MKKFAVLLLAAFAASAVFANAWDGVLLKGRTDKDNPVGYASGEPIVFTIRTDGLDAVPTNNNYRVRSMDPDNIRAISKTLEHAEILCGGDKTLRHALGITFHTDLSVRSDVER